MKPVRPRASVIALCLLAGACSGPTAPASYAGQWTGTTAQGTAIAFTISPDDEVTTISLGYDFNGCAGSQTFSSLNLSIVPSVQCIPGPCPASLSSYRSFGYSSGNPITGPSTDISAVFSSSASAQGQVNLRNYPACGSAIGVPWSATRR
jgi:hypothetical protein